MNVNNLMSTGVSVLILTLLITQVIIPFLQGLKISEDFAIVGKLVGLFPLLLAVGGLLAITNMFTQRN